MLRPLHQACWATLALASIVIADDGHLGQITLDFNRCGVDANPQDLANLRGIHYEDAAVDNTYKSDGTGGRNDDWLVFKSIYANFSVGSTLYMDTYGMSWNSSDPNNITQECGTNVVQTIKPDPGSWSRPGGSYCFDLTAANGTYIVGEPYCLRFYKGPAVGNSQKRREHGREIRRFRA